MAGRIYTLTSYTNKDGTVYPVPADSPEASDAIWFVTNNRVLLSGYSYGRWVSSGEIHDVELSIDEFEDAGTKLASLLSADGNTLSGTLSQLQSLIGVDSEDGDEEIIATYTYNKNPSFYTAQSAWLGGYDMGSWRWRNVAKVSGTGFAEGDIILVRHTNTATNISYSLLGVTWNKDNNSHFVHGGDVMNGNAYGDSSDGSYYSGIPTGLRESTWGYRLTAEDATAINESGYFYIEGCGLTIKQISVVSDTAKISISEDFGSKIWMHIIAKNGFDLDINMNLYDFSLSIDVIDQGWYATHDFSWKSYYTESYHKTWEGSCAMNEDGIMTIVDLRQVQSTVIENKEEADFSSETEENCIYFKNEYISVGSATANWDSEGYTLTFAKIPNALQDYIELNWAY